MTMSKEQRAAQSERMKARHAGKRAEKAEKSAENGWTDEQKADFKQAKTVQNEVKQENSVRDRLRVNANGRRDVTAVHRDEDYHAHSKDRWVNDVPGRIDEMKKRGYVLSDTDTVGDPNIDGTHNANGNISREMGKGVTAYLMTQSRRNFDEDSADKQKIVDSTEEDIVRNKNDDRNDGTYGEVKIS